MKKLVLLILALLYFIGIFAQSGNYQKVTLEKTEVISLHSEIVGQEYELFISLPKSYSQSNSTYPVIIGLDAYTGFLIMKGCVDAENKILFGASFGGLFALYTLFHAPETFNKYFIESPNINYNNDIAFGYESDFAKNHSDLNADIFMCAGSLENPHAANVKKMDSLLFSRNYPQLNLETVIFENENHISCAPAAVSRGLIELFNNK